MGKYKKLLLIISVMGIACTFKKAEPSKDGVEILQIHLKEFELYFFPDSCKSNVGIEIEAGQKRLEINLLDCKGQLSFKLFDSTNRLVLKGQYLNSLDTLQKYSIGRSAIDGTKELGLMKYFEPLPNGEWTYYKSGVIDNIVCYDDGLKVDMCDYK